MDGFFSPPSVITGLLGEQEAERLRKQSIGTGLVGALIGGLSAAPNYRYGGIAPILGQALKSGFEGMQGTYTSALENYQTQQRLAEAQRQQQERQATQEALSGLSEEDQRLFRLLGPSGYGQIAAQRAKPPESRIGKFNPSDFTPESLAQFEETGNIRVLQFKPEAQKQEKPSLQDADRYASSMFGMPFYQLNQQQQQAVNRRLESLGLEKARATVPQPPSRQPSFADAAQLRDEFRKSKEFQAFQEMKAAYSTIENASRLKTPVADLALATKIMKLLDPGSVVRESELALAMGAGALMDRAMEYANQIKTGQKLTPTQREEFRILAKSVFDSAATSFQDTQNYYAGIARTGGLDPNLVIGGSGLPKGVKVERVGD
jgi:hypothetical protein